MNKTLTISFLFLLGYSLVFIPTKTVAQNGCFSGISKTEMELLLKDANPLMLKRLAEDAEMKKAQIRNLKELLATACQAVKEGFAEQYNAKQELENIEIEITAVNYDREINKGNDAALPFGKISKTQIDEFYADKNNVSAFESFLKYKLELTTESGQIEKDRQISKDEIEQAKQYFAKTRIYYTESQKKADSLSKEFWDKTAISVKLQKASFLSRIYSEKVLREKAKVTDAEIQNYIAAHPEYDTKVQKAKAYKILQRIEAGENFAKLAKEFSEDPASKDKGGLYQKVNAGQFMLEFEKAALSLKVGEIYQNLVETSYGFHIIKLEGKRQIKNANGEMIWNYDVRHILVSTAINDENNPINRPIPVREFVKTKLETEKETVILNKILSDNPIEVAEDFVIPQVTDEEIQKQIRQNSQNFQD